MFVGLSSKRGRRGWGMENNVRNLQLIELEILDEFNRICKKYNLTYYLSYGTLIGAIRHKGFIPWDDDLDVVMFKEDYDRLIEVAPKEIDSKRFYFHDYSDPQNPAGLLRIRKKGTVYADDKFLRMHLESYGIWMDIFRLDNVESPKLFTFKLQTFAKVLEHICIHRAIVDIKGLSIPRKLVHYFSLILPLRKWRSLIDNIYTLCRNDNSEFVANFNSRYSAQIELMPRSMFGEPVLVEFEKKMYPAPHDYDSILKHIYGDYMQLPPEDKRVTHRPDVWKM